MAEVKPAEVPTATEKVEAPAPQPAETAQPASIPAKEETTTAPPAPEPATAAVPDTTTTAETPVVEPSPSARAFLKNEQWGTICTPLEIIFDRVPEILSISGHAEIWGVTLVPGSDAAPEPKFTTLLILQKFLRANANDVNKATDQLIKTLKWRKEFQPLEALAAEHDRARFGGLGYVQVNDARGYIATWNIYGAVKDFKKTFGDLDAFLKWRVALMEAAVAKLDLANATKPIPDYGTGTDPYQIIQIHDYLNVSFLRMDPHVKTASKYAVEIFTSYYPELLSKKYFINVPVLMGWMFSAMKMIMPKTTIDKFNVLSYGNKLHEDLGPEVPEAYGGKGMKDLSELGEPVKLVDKTDEPVATA